MYNKNLMKSYQGLPCVCCGTTRGTVAHHVKSRGSGGSDEPHNLMVLCDSTHKLIHQHGLSYVVIMHPTIKAWLIENGWEKCEYRDKWVRYTETRED